MEPEIFYAMINNKPMKHWADPEKEHHCNPLKKIFHRIVFVTQILSCPKEKMPEDFYWGGHPGLPPIRFNQFILCLIKPYPEVGHFIPQISFCPACGDKLEV